jgi:hypothetical protein
VAVGPDWFAAGALQACGRPRIFKGQKKPAKTKGR